MLKSVVHSSARLGGMRKSENSSEDAVPATSMASAIATQAAASGRMGGLGGSGGVGGTARTRPHPGGARLPGRVHHLAPLPVCRDSRHSLAQHQRVDVMRAL